MPLYYCPKSFVWVVVSIKSRIIGEEEVDKTTTRG
jgi:hypothetical protein